jgi:1,2-diacylglycerol 3-alpha-glucosyltransferase
VLKREAGMKQNIGIVTTWFERGAAYVSRQYMEIIQETQSVFIYVRGGERFAQGNPEWDLPNVTWGKKVNMPRSVANYIDKADLKRWLTRNNIDIVIFNEQQYWQPILLCNDLGIKTCAYIDYYTEETLPLFGLYDILLCNTRRHAEAFDWHKQAFYIPWGTQPDIFTPPANKVTTPNGVVRFFHSAGMDPIRKGTDYVIQAFMLLLKKGVKNIFLILHLQTDLSTFYPRLDKDVATLRGQGLLTIINKSVRRPGLYHLGDVYVYPSRLEGIGLSLSEALSCGLPAITTNHPPMNEFALSEGCQLVKTDRLFARKDGYYWPQCTIDIKDLSEKMEYFAINIKKIEQFSKSARDYALEKLNWKTNASRLTDILLHASKLDKSESLAESAIRYDNRKYPGVTKTPKLFSLLVLLKRLIEKKPIKCF